MLSKIIYNYETENNIERRNKMSLKYLNRSIGRINTSVNLRKSENDLIIKNN